MPKKKTRLDQAAESGDWKRLQEQAERDLRKSSARILRARSTKDAPKGLFKGIDRDEPEPVDASDDEVQEHVDDAFTEDADELPSDDQEKELGPAETRQVVTLKRAYEQYRERGGYRVLDHRVLEYFGPMDVEKIDRQVTIEGAHRFYPNHTPAQRAELVHDPLAEILGGIRRTNAKGTVWRRMPLRRREADHGAGPLAREEEKELERSRRELEPSSTEAEEYIKLVLCQGDYSQENAEWLWSNRHDVFQMTKDGRWTIDMLTSLPFLPPTPDPPEKSTPVPGRGVDRWRYKHRGFLSALERPDGRRLKFGYPPRIGQSRDNPYYGYESKMGRPSKPDKLTAAEKMRRHRARKKQLRRT